MKKSLEEFVNKLASAAPTPGGGSAAALVCALGLGLLEMVGRLNDRRMKKRSPHLKKLRRLRLLAFGLIARDAAVFQKMTRFFSVGGSSTRRQSALKRCAKVPLQVCECAAEGFALSALEKNRTQGWLKSDFQEARLLLKNAFDSGRLQVETNLKAISDRAFVRRKRRALAKLLKEFSP